MTSFGCINKSLICPSASIQLCVTLSCSLMDGWISIVSHCYRLYYSLLGCCDGNPEDDLMLPNGTVVRELEDMMLFLQAWRVHTTDESEHMRRVGDNCTIGDCSTCLSMLFQRAFMPCHSKVGAEVANIYWFILCLVTL